ncbi:MAG: hypothetical protein SPJ62_03190 [Inconstantimicrobium porci]|uniref:hypothetical protein n=1 Tax=Inconstantimicrobium porci TaxID=2652291 RepID=UPI002A917A45|nr:hypothetical protein [Inconstantimicrobium porci]MDY5911017.1 hypothetical protein [Inconstantimicrobium porci]
MLENGEKNEETELSQDAVENEETVSVDESKDQNETLPNKEEIESSSDAEELTEEPIKELVKNTEVKSGFVARFTANLVDQVLILALTLAVFFAVKGILYLCGLEIKEGYESQMALIEYVVLNLLYVPITEATKLKKTLGKELLKVK